jgi:hypothetical protein
MWEVLMYIVSHRNSKGCSYAAWKGVWPLWVLVGQATCFTDRVTDVPTLFGEDWMDVHCVVQRTVTVWKIGWKLWMLLLLKFDRGIVGYVLAGHKLNYRVADNILSYTV